MQNTEKAEGRIFQDIENVTINHGLSGNKADMPTIVDSDNYTIAQLYRFVKTHPRKDGGIRRIIGREIESQRRAGACSRRKNKKFYNIYGLRNLARYIANRTIQVGDESDGIMLAYRDISDYKRLYEVALLSNSLSLNASQVEKLTEKLVARDEAEEEAIPDFRKHQKEMEGEERLTSKKKYALGEKDIVEITIKKDPALTKRISESDKSRYDVIRQYLIDKFEGETFNLSDGKKAIMDRRDAKEMSRATKKRFNLGTLEK